MNPAEFQEALLQIMEAKRDPDWISFTSGRVPRDRLHVHLEQEYEVYVRDFPVLVARAYVRCPHPAARRELIENVYEEETGGLVAGRPHPELFLDYPRGLGMDLERFSSIRLLPAARTYRELLDERTLYAHWSAAAAITTLFLEGTSHDRSVLDPTSPPRPEPPLKEHPLVKHYGLPVENLRLTKAHRAVEGEHREAAWKVVLTFTPSEQREPVVRAMHEILASWLAYRAEVARSCGV